MTIDVLNGLPEAERRQALLNCCGSRRWVELMQAAFPVSAEADLFRHADQAWAQCGEPDWLEAFTHHPKIGDLDSLKKKFAATAQWAGSEQGAVAAAAEEILKALAEGNNAYEEKFGFIFIVCATGKSAEEMLALLRQRLPRNRDEELRTARDEQHKITLLRLQKLLA